MIRDVTVTVSLFHPSTAPPDAAPLGPPQTVSDGPTAAKIGDGKLLALLLALAESLLRKYLPPAAAVLLMLGAVGSASAANPCGGGGNGRQGGPIRNAIQQARENAQERRAARGCQLRTEAFPAPPAVEGVPGVVTYHALPASCPSGVCPVPR